MRRLAAVGMAMVLALALTACEPEDGVTPAATKGQKVTVPDVVGQRLSDAGAAMLKVGLTHVDSHDATDQHRAVLNGNKWVVVSQQPKAGDVVTGNVKVTLAVKRPSEVK